MLSRLRNKLVQRNQALRKLTTVNHSIQYTQIIKRFTATAKEELIDGIPKSVLKSKSFKTLSGLFIFTSILYIGGNIYVSEFLPKSFESIKDKGMTVDELIDALTVWSKAQMSLNYLSCWEPLYKAGVVDLALKQIRQAYEQSKKVDEPALQALIFSIEEPLAELCQMEHVAREVVQKGGMELIVKIFQDERYQQQNIQDVNNKLFVTIMQHADKLQKELAPYQKDVIGDFKTPPPFTIESLLPPTERWVGRAITFGLVGGLYCALRWKFAAPQIASGVLTKKASAAFLGLGAYSLVADAYNGINKPFMVPKINDRIKNSEANVYSPSTIRNLGTGLFIADNTIFLAALYYGKYVFVPGLLTGTLLVLWEVYFAAKELEQEQKNKN